MALSFSFHLVCMQITMVIGFRTSVLCLRTRLIFQPLQSTVNQRGLAKRNEDSPMLQQNLAWGLGGGGGWGAGVGRGKQGVLWEMRDASTEFFSQIVSSCVGKFQKSI